MWNDDFHHTARVALTGRREAYYSDYRGHPQELVSAIKYGFLYQGQRYHWQQKPRGSLVTTQPAFTFVIFTQNHDQVANSLQGERITALTSPARYRALTWMDAKVGDWVVTPRRGKPVEIQALWYNALRLMAIWAAEFGEPHKEFMDLAQRAAESFNTRFWFEPGRYLFDVVDGEAGDDASFRLNQLFALSLRFPILTEQFWHPVLEAITTKLLTPVGLRTLVPGHKDYKSCYAGDLRSRDAAYHQGTVWPWLIGHFLDAWRRTYADNARARTFLSGFDEALRAAGIGTLSEIFDAEPPYTARGCIAQAWSVAEVLRSFVALDEQEAKQ